METSHPSQQSCALIGKRLALARILRNMTQEDMAHACGVSRRMIQHMEAGRNVGVFTVIKAASQLDYLPEILAVLEQKKPATMEQFQSVLKGRHEHRKRASR